MEGFHSKAFYKYSPKFFPETFLFMIATIALMLIINFHLPKGLNVSTTRDFLSPYLQTSLPIPELSGGEITIIITVSLLILTSLYLSLKNLANGHALRPGESRFMVSVALLLYGFFSLVTVYYDLSIFGNFSLWKLVQLLGPILFLFQSLILISVVLDRKSDADQKDAYDPHVSSAKGMFLQISVLILLIFMAREINLNFFSAFCWIFAFYNFISIIIHNKYPGVEKI
jgi:hypothetical protein